MDEIGCLTRGFAGLRPRLYAVERQEWPLDWANTRTGTLFPRVVGRFADGRGGFCGDDAHQGRPGRVRCLWYGTSPPSTRGEQAFSLDGGATWLTNWTMEFARKT